MRKNTGTYERLLNAGVLLFSENSINAVGMTEILSHAGVTRGSFYHFFDSKQAFVSKVISISDSLFSCDTTYLRAGTLDEFIAALRDTLINYLRCKSKLGYIYGINAPVAAEYPAIRVALESYMIRSVANISQALAGIQDQAGFVSRFSVEHSAQILWDLWQVGLVKSRFQQSDQPLFNALEHFELLYRKPAGNLPLGTSVYTGRNACPVLKSAGKGGRFSES